MGNRLFVGNLPFDATEKQIREMFSDAGHTAVSVKLIVDRDTGRSRGFAFAEFETEEAARAAIGELNGKDFGGRAIVVNEAQERSGGAGGFRGPSGGGFRGGAHVERDQRRGGGFGSRGPGQQMPRGSQRGGGRGGTRGT